MNSQSIDRLLPNQSPPKLVKGKEYKKVKVRILMVNQQELLGTVIIQAQGYKARLSDFLNNDLKFLSLTDVEVYQDNLLITKTPFLSVNKQTIIYLAEDEANQLNNCISLPVKIE